MIASNNLDIYHEHEKCWRSYSKSHADVTVYFIRQREDVTHTYIDGDTIWSSGHEATERVFEKTVAAFKLLNPDSYNYLVRTNLSSVWNFSKLIEFCTTLPKRNVFCGVLGNPGISGAGMILSPDVVQTLANYNGPIERCMWDDIDFGKIAALCNIPSTPATRYDLRSRVQVDKYWMYGYHYYLKNMQNGVRNIQDEIDVMRYLISRIYRI